MNTKRTIKEIVETRAFSAKGFPCAIKTATDFRIYDKNTRIISVTVNGIEYTQGFWTSRMYSRTSSLNAGWRFAVQQIEK